MRFCKRQLRAFRNKCQPANYNGNLNPPVLPAIQASCLRAAFCAHRKEFAEKVCKKSARQLPIVASNFLLSFMPVRSNSCNSPNRNFCERRKSPRYSQSPGLPSTAWRKPDSFPRRSKSATVSAGDVATSKRLRLETGSQKRPERKNARFSRTSEPGAYFVRYRAFRLQDERTIKFYPKLGLVERPERISEPETHRRRIEGALSRLSRRGSLPRE